MSYWRAAGLHFSWPSRENWAERVTGWRQQGHTLAQQLPGPNHGPGLAECGRHTPVNAKIASDRIRAHGYTLVPSQSLWGKTCGRSSVWSQWSGRGVLAVSSNVCILWHKSELVLLLSPAEQTHRMSIGNPAARRVTDVKRDDCTTFSPYWETNLQLLTSNLTSELIKRKAIAVCLLTHFMQHVCRDTPNLWITASSQSDTEFGEAYTASLHCPLVEKSMFYLRNQPFATHALKVLPLSSTYPMTTFKKNIPEYLWCSP